MSGLKGFLDDNARWVGGAFLLTFLSSFGQTFFISLFAPEIKATYSLSDGQWGSAYMVATLASALTLVHLGRVVDQFSIAAVAVLTSIVLAIGCAAMALGEGSVLVLIGVVYLLRLFGQGMLTHTAMTAMGRWYSAERGRAISIATLGHQVGEFALPITFLSLAAIVGWRSGWFVCAIVLLICAPFAYRLLVRPRQPQSTGPNPVHSTVRDWMRRDVLRDAGFYVLLMGLLAPAFIGTSAFFHQALLMETKGLARETFAWGSGLMALTTACFVMIAGGMIDRFSAVRLARYYLVPLGFGCLVLGMASSAWSVMFFMILMGMTYGFSSTIISAILPELYGVRHLGSIRAVVMAGMVFFSAAGPGITGALIDAGIGFETQLVFMGAYCLLVTGLLVLVSRHFMHRLARDAAHLLKDGVP